MKVNSLYSRIISVCVSNYIVEPTARNGMMIGEYEKEFEVSNFDLIYYATIMFVWRNCGKTKKKYQINQYPGKIRI